LKRLQSVSVVVAVVCGVLALATATGCPAFPPGDPSAARWLHPLVILLGLGAGALASRRSRAIDDERWRVVDDSSLTSGEREYAHREAESGKRAATVQFLVAPIAVGLLLAYQFKDPDGFSAAELLTLTPLVGFALGLLVGSRGGRRGGPPDADRRPGR